MNAEPYALPQAPTYVGFWQRAFAALVDSVLMMILLAPFTGILYGRLPGHMPQDRGPAHFVISVLIPAMAVLLFWARRQATPGKILVRARIVDARTGEDPEFGQLVLRYLGYYVSGIVLGLGFFWIAFDARKQGWHDKIAKTVVVRDTPSGDALTP